MKTRLMSTKSNFITTEEVAAAEAILIECVKMSVSYESTNSSCVFIYSIFISEGKKRGSNAEGSFTYPAAFININLHGN